MSECPEFDELYKAVPFAADKIEATCDRLKETLLEKNEAYGDAVFHKPLFSDHLTAQDALLIRIGDKIKRVAHLYRYADAQLREQGSKSEALDDSLLDMAGYCVLLLIAREGRAK